MADIKLKVNSDTVLRLKALGLSSSEIKRIIEALEPTFDTKAEKDLTNVDNDIFKAKSEEAGVGNNDFIVNATWDGSETVEFDKTFKEVKAAYDAGRSVLCRCVGTGGEVNGARADITDFSLTDDYIAWTFILTSEKTLVFFLPSQSDSTTGEAFVETLVTIEAFEEALLCKLDIPGQVRIDDTVGVWVNNYGDNDRNVSVSDYDEDGNETIHKLTEKANWDDVVNRLSYYALNSDMSLKLNKPTLSSPLLETGVQLLHNTETHCGEMTEIYLVFDDTEIAMDLYWSSFCFTSGETATVIVVQGSPTIIFVGDDCDASGVFTPQANTSYEVSVKKLGDDIVARVGAY